MRNKKIFLINIIAVLSAVIFVMAITPYVGLIPVGPVTITTLTIPVIIGGILFGPKAGGILGFIFGLGTLCVAFMRPSAPTDIAFQNPLVSILPRVLFGISIGLCFNLLKKVIKNEKIIVVTTSVLVSLFHSVVTLTCLYLFGREQVYEAFGGSVSIWKLLYTIISINGLVELIIAAILIPSIYFALNKYVSKIMDNYNV